MSGLEAWGTSVLPDTMSESEFTSKIIGLCRQTGWKVTHFKAAPNRTGRGRKYITHLEGHKGYPDLTMARDGVVIFAELKSAKGSLRAEQREWLAAFTVPEFLDDGSWIPPHKLAELTARDQLRPGEHYPTVWRPCDWPHIVQTLTQQKAGNP